MREVIQTKGRVEQLDGLHFYEQDIVMLDYLYDGDVTIDFNVLYSMPGFGVIFAEKSTGVASYEEAPSSVLVKIGSLDFSIYKKEFGIQRRFYNASCLIQPDKSIHKFRFQKTGRYIYCYELKGNGSYREIGHKDIKQNIDRYYIGIYSNKCNIVISADIYDNRPQFWFTNIKNTNGGRISFEQDTMLIEQAEKNIEVEQEKIYLAKGRYFLDYKKAPVDDLLDEASYVFDYTGINNKIHAKDKNKLKTDALRYGDHKYFDMESDGYVNLLFQIGSGKIYDIAIKDDYRQDYVSSDDEATSTNGSYILLKLKGLKKAEWTGSIYKVPETTLLENKTYSLFSYAGDIISLEKANIKLNQSYKYVFEKTSEKNVWVLTVYNNDNTKIYTKTYNSKNDSARIFDDISGIITKLILVSDDGTLLDVLHQNTLKKYVPSAITSPIIVTDKSDIPFDLSASYRLMSNGKYYFTVWEREYFKTDNKLKLARPLLGGDNIIVYGIKDSDIDLDNIYKVKDNEHINDISAVTTRYDSISSGLYKIISDQILSLDESIMHCGYTGFIVDYLKLNSYAINISNDGTEYIVDIATNEDTVNTMYDMTADGQIRTYKINNRLNPPDNNYLVLRKGGADN